MLQRDLKNFDTCPADLTSTTHIQAMRRLFLTDQCQNRRSRFPPAQQLEGISSGEARLTNDLTEGISPQRLGLGAVRGKGFM